MTANKYIAEVDAPEFGEGYTIRLDMRGQAILESRFGEFEFAGKVNFGLSIMNSTYLQAFLDVALRKDGEIVPANGALENGPIAPIAKKCLDSFTLFREGITAEALIARNEQEMARRKNPSKGTEA
jgi:hypothetical protein